MKPSPISFSVMAVLVTAMTKKVDGLRKAGVPE